MKLMWMTKKNFAEFKFDEVLIKLLQESQAD